MYDDLYKHKGGVYLVSFPDGTEIPFTPLSYGDFNYYDDARRTEKRYLVELEDEIFSKCVLDKSIIRTMGRQKSGTISTVVHLIMAASGPSDIDDFNNALSYHRQVAANPINYIIGLICRAFPAYKPEDILDMNFENMMVRLAQAEEALLRTGYITQPIQLLDPEKAPRNKGIHDKFNARELKAAHEQALGFADPTSDESFRHPSSRVRVPLQDLPKPAKKSNKPVSSKVSVRKHMTGAKATKVGELPSPALDQRHDIMKLLHEGLLNPGSEARGERAQHISEAQEIYKDLISEMKKKAEGKG